MEDNIDLSLNTRSGNSSLKRKSINDYTCILLCGKTCSVVDSLDTITSVKWNSIQEKAIKWRGLDTFGNVHCSVDWEKGPTDLYMHSSCYTTLSSNYKLGQAERRHERNDQTVKDVEDVLDDIDESHRETSASKKLRSNTGRLHDKTLCIWCMKGDDVKHKTRDKQLILLSTVAAWNKFRSHTVRLEDSSSRERLCTLIDSIPDAETAFGIEIRYHRECWRKYITDYKPLTYETTQHLQRVNLREAQTLFFDHVRKVIFDDHELRTLQGLLNDYVRIVSDFGHSSVVKSSYLKEILVKEFGEDIGFHERNQRNVSELVYDTSAGGTYIEAAISSLGVSNDQLILNVSERIKKEVMQTNTIPWPPYIHELEKDEQLSELLLKLITWVKHPNVSIINDSPTIRSIASILTSYITGKRTTFKANISVMLHGLAKSREVIDIMHSDGLAISYNDVLMLRDFWVVNDLKRSLNCPFELKEGKPAIAIVDNDDFKTDTLTGSGQPHRTNVMFVQPVSLNCDHLVESNDESDRPFPSATLASSLSASLKELGCKIQTLNPYKTVKRGEPPIRKLPHYQDIVTSAHRRRGIIHELCRSQNDRSRPDPEEQKVPGFSGFYANMSEAVPKSQAIYHMTYPDPPSKTILYDVLCKLERSIREKKMPFAIIVGDQPVYVLMLELKSENTELFDNILPFMGPFHIQMSFMYAIYKRFNGSGLSDLLVAAGVIAEGSVDQALRGKHFKRGVRCLKLLYEALMHLAVDKRILSAPLSQELISSLDKIRVQRDTPGETLSDVYTRLECDIELMNLVDTLFSNFHDDPLAEYWISFLDMVEVLTQNIHALRTGNWSEFKSSLKLMLPWMQVYDNDKYGRYLPDFIAVLDTIPADQLAFMESGLFAQSMTGKPYSSVALDIWIESTMNKGSKLKSGWLAILNNEKQLLSNTRNVNNINRVRNSVHHHANYKEHANEKHADCSSSKIRKDEQAVQDLLSCMSEFNCDPFDHSNQILRSLQSGIPASDLLAADLKSARKDGINKVNEFLAERVYSKDKSLNDRVTRSRRLNFASHELKKAHGDTTKITVEEMESKALASVLALAETSGTLKLEDVLKHRVTRECLSIFNANGTMRKVQKSKLQESFSMTDIPEPRVYTSIVDMGFIWRLAAPSTEDREKSDGTKYTWGDYAKKVVSSVLNRHKYAERIICLNDAYDQKYTIKDSERNLRTKGTPISNVFMKANDKFPSIKDFNNLLGNSDNKIRLQAFLQTEFQRQVSNINAEIIYCVVCSSANNLSTNTSAPDFACTHAEADTAMFTIYNALRSKGYTEAVILDTEDTDNYVQAAYVAHQIPGLLCIKRKRQILNARLLCSSEMAIAIIPLHVLTGCDHNSGFYGTSKKTIASRVQISKEAQNLLSSCGTELPVSQNVIESLEQFVIRYVYNDVTHDTLAEVRSSKWRSMKNKNTIRIAPDSDSLHQHLQRANYLAYLQTHFQLHTHPSPIGHGWHLVDGFCLPIRSTQPALPDSISLFSLQNEQDNNENSDIDESSSECDSSDLSDNDT